MSYRKSNKSKKTSNQNQNNINAFRIEQLEPRILMSATAAEWQTERGNPFCATAALSLRAERGNPFCGTTAPSLRAERGNPFWRTAALSLRAERGNPFRGEGLGYEFNERRGKYENDHREVIRYPGGALRGPGNHLVRQRQQGDRSSGRGLLGQRGRHFQRRRAADKLIERRGGTPEQRSDTGIEFRRDVHRERQLRCVLGRHAGQIQQLCEQQFGQRGSLRRGGGKGIKVFPFQQTGD